MTGLNGRRYTAEFYRHVQETALRAAREVVPFVVDLLKPASVVDVGCGSGSWLRVFRELGVGDIFGIDGRLIPAESLQIPPHLFAAMDLGQPFEIDRRFDLAVCLEVAEHLPASRAVGFVTSLVKLSPRVLFSAAIPGQGGTAHLNEQWQDYWAALFQRHSFVPVDCLRARFWTNDKVAFYYAQNMILYCDASIAMSTRQLGRFAAESTSIPLNLVHPLLYERATKPGMRRLAAAAPGALGRSISARVRRGAE